MFPGIFGLKNAGWGWGARKVEKESLLPSVVPNQGGRGGGGGKGREK